MKMGLDNFQRKENTDPSLNTAKEAIKETKNSLNSLEKETLISTIKWALETNILLFNKKGQENEVAEYLLNGDYKSWKNIEIEWILDQISFSNLTLYNTISGYVNPIYKQRLKPIIQQSSAIKPEKSDNWLFNKIVSGAKETASTISDKISTAVDNTSELLSDFFWSVSKLVNIDGVPSKQIPILKSMIEGGQKVFDKLYKLWWSWNTIDCSGLVSLLLRAWGAFSPREYLTSSGLYQKFVKHKVMTQSVRAGDLMFWGNWGGGHVEMVVWKPYQKSGKLCVKTLWSSSDTTKISPMYNSDGSPSSKTNGVAYRERVIQDRHQFLRPQYEKLVAENQKKKK